MANTAYQGAEDEALIQVNTLLLNDLNAKVKACPARDMTDLLDHKAKTYPALRKAFSDVSVQPTTERLDHSDVTSLVDERGDFRVPTDAMVVRPLSVMVKQELLKDSDGELSGIIEGHVRVAPGPIGSETEFNEFLTFNPQRTLTPFP